MQLGASTPPVFLARPQPVSAVTSSFLPAQRSHFRLWGPIAKKGTGPYILLKCLSIWPRFLFLENEAGQAYLGD